MRERLSNRDNIFYFVVVGLIFLITLVWVGIYLLYTFGDNGFGSVAVVSPTATNTAAPSTTTSVPPTITATTDTAPTAPSGLTTASVLASGVTIDWEGSTEADVRGYNVYRSDAANGPFTKLNNELILVSQYTDVNAPLGQDSFYRVTAIDRAGQESKPTPIRVNVPAVPPTATIEPTPTATITPTATLAPTNAPPLEVTRVVPGPPLEVTRVVPVTPVPSRTSVPTQEPTVAPTSTDVPPTDIPEPTAVPPTPWPTPIPAATEAPTPQPQPTQDTAQSSSPAATEVASPVVLTPEAPPASELPAVSPTE
jgi:hypothetical protein